MHDDLLCRLKRSPVAQLLVAITFLTSGLILNLIQCILYFTIRPFNKHLFRKINYYPNYSLHSQLVCLAEWWGDLDVTCYSEEADRKYFGNEHAYCIMNHRYEIDWMVGFVYCDRVGILGNCKTYAKKSIQYVPLLGWAWKFAESVFLDRSWEKDKEIIGRQVTELVNYPDPMWLLLTAEGTRLTPAKLAASQKFAREKGLPELHHHLTPRTKGFTYSVPYLRGKVDAVYDVQVLFKEGNGETEPTMTNLLMARRVEAHYFMKRIPLELLPEGEQELSDWMHALYQKKDRMAAEFERSGRLFDPSDPAAAVTTSYRLERRPYSLINTATWAVVVLVPMMYYLACLLLSGSTLYFSIGAAIIAVFSVTLRKLINLTKISKGSEYGTHAKAAAAKRD